MPVDNSNNYSKKDPISSSQGDKISALPNTYINALSAIQEQSFIDSETEDYGLYSKLFTNNHKIAFFKTGFITAMLESFLLVIGYVLYQLTHYKILTPFGHEHLNLIDKFTLLLIQFFPYLLTLFLTAQTFSYLTGEIPRKMAKFLLSGFFCGSLFTILFLIILNYWSGIEYAEGVYKFLIIFSQKVADFFWYYLRVVFEKGIWDETIMILSVNFLLFLIYFIQIKRIDIQKNIDEHEEEF